MQRKTLNFTAASADLVAPFLVPGSPERLALEELAGEAFNSESDVLRALVRLGIEAVGDHRLEVGYAAWGAKASEEDERWARTGRELVAEAWRDA